MTSLFFAVSVLYMLKYNSHKRWFNGLDRFPHLSLTSACTRCTYRESTAASDGVWVSVEYGL